MRCGVFATSAASQRLDGRQWCSGDSIGPHSHASGFRADAFRGRGCICLERQMSTVESAFARGSEIIALHRAEQNETDAPRGNNPIGVRSHMAAKSEEKAAPAAEVAEKDSPLLDLSDQSVKKLLKVGKQRGYVTYDELNTVLPSEEVSSEQIEDTMAMLSEMGINVVEPKRTRKPADERPMRPRRGGRPRGHRAGAARQGRRRAPSRPSAPTIPCACTCARWARRAAVARGRNRHRQAHRGRPRGDDRGPLREPADVPGDHHLARRAQRRQDAAARHHRSRGDLRGARGEGGAAAAGHARQRQQRVQRRPHAPATWRRRGEGERRAAATASVDEDDEYENALSLAAMEAELKPKVLETFDNIAGNYKKLRKQQDKKLEQQVAGEQPARASSRRPTRSCARRSSRTSRACRSTTTVSRASSSSSTRSTSA